VQSQQCHLIEDETWHIQYGPENKQGGGGGETLLSPRPESFYDITNADNAYHFFIYNI